MMLILGGNRRNVLSGEYMNIKFENGSSIETIDTIENPKRGQRAKIYPVDDYREPSVCDDCEIIEIRTWII